MKATIDVTHKREGELIRQALADPTTRAFVNIMGALLPLSAHDQQRVLAFVSSKLPENQTPGNVEG